MATHSSVLAQRIPWTEEPSGLQTFGSQSRTGLKLFSTEHTWALHRESSRTRCAPSRAVSIKLSVKMFRNLLDSWLFVGDLLVCLFISLESFNNLCIPSILNLHENDGSMPCVCVCVLVTHSCPALWDTMDCSPPGSSFYGILKARILEWVVIPFSRGSS